MASSNLTALQARTGAIPLPGRLVRGRLVPRRAAGFHPALASCLGFVFYVSILVLTRPVDASGGDSSFKGQVAGVLGFVLLCLPFLGTSLAIQREGLRRSNLILLLFWASLVVMTCFARRPVLSAIYLVMTFLVYFSAGAIWLAPRRWLQVAFGMVGCVCLGFCGYAAASHGIGIGRFVGAMTPNHFAAIALTPVLLAFALPRWIRRSVVVISLGLILFVGARGSLIALVLCVTTTVVMRVLVHRQLRAVSFGLAIAAVVLPLAALVPALHEPSRNAVGGTVNRILALDAPDRGLESGFSGRTEGWEIHGREIVEHLVAGSGFRSARGEQTFATTHNAWLDLVKETGVVGAMLFVLFVAVRMTQLVRVALCRRLDIHQRELAAGVFGSMCAIIFLGFFEAWLLNIGFPIGAVALMLYAYREPLPDVARDAQPARGMAS